MRIEKFDYYYNLSGLLELNDGSLYLVSRKKWCKKSHQDTIVSIGTYNYRIREKSMLTAELIYVDQTSYLREKIEINNNVINIIPFFLNNQIAFSKIDKKPYHILKEKHDFPLLVAPNGFLEMGFSWADCTVIHALAYYKPNSLFIDNKAVNYISVDFPIFAYMQFDRDLMIEYFCKSIDNVYYLTIEDLVRIKNECVKKELPQLIIGLADGEIVV